LDEQTELLREMRDLLRVMAEPALADRDKKLRSSLLEIVGKSEQKASVVLLMNGLRSQAELSKESGMDRGNVSRLVTALRAKDLIKADEKHPELVISIPPNFFENSEARR
jgi:DNA-binding MarR family transcriptional regulator